MVLATMAALTMAPVAKAEEDMIVTAALVVAGDKIQALVVPTIVALIATKTMEALAMVLATMAVLTMVPVAKAEEDTTTIVAPGVTAIMNLAVAVPVHMDQVLDMAEAKIPDMDRAPAIMVVALVLVTREVLMAQAATAITTGAQVAAILVILALVIRAGLLAAPPNASRDVAAIAAA
jgi:hypothetical protein